jgi:hypothetical protein
MTRYKRRLTWSHELDKWSDVREADEEVAIEDAVSDAPCPRGSKKMNAGMAFRISNTGDGVESRSRQDAKHPWLWDSQGPDSKPLPE